jgi:hypothetical protein
LLCVLAACLLASSISTHYAGLVGRHWRRLRKDGGAGRRDGADAVRHTGSDEDDEYQELDERLDYNIPESFRVIVRCVASLVLAPCLICVCVCE